MKLTTLNRNGDFRRAYARGKSCVNPALVTYVCRNRLGICRIGITASKKTGKAVTRNRARRVIKAALQQLAPRMSGGWDIVFVARARTAYLKSTILLPVMQAHLQSAGVLARRDEK